MTHSEPESHEDSESSEAEEEYLGDGGSSRELCCGFGIALFLCLVLAGFFLSKAQGA